MKIQRNLFVLVTSLATFAVFSVAPRPAKAAFQQTRFDSCGDYANDYPPWTSWGSSNAFASLMNNSNARSGTYSWYFGVGSSGTTSDFSVLEKSFPFGEPGGPATYISLIATSVYLKKGPVSGTGVDGALQILDGSGGPLTLLASTPFTITSNTTYQQIQASVSRTGLAHDSLTKRILVRIVVSGGSGYKALFADDAFVGWTYNN